MKKIGGAGVMAVSYTANGDIFTASTQRVWSAVNLLPTGYYSNYDLAPDGKRIATMLAGDDAESQKPITHLTFLLNFFEELRRKAPGKN